MTVLLAIDSDAHACATYAANVPGARVVCGMVEPDAVAPLRGSVDVLCGGPPCQPFSVAGEGEGDQDERDGLPVFLACIEASRPRHVVMENVPGLVSDAHAETFWRFIDGLTALGYAVQWRLLDAMRFGVPQFRKRVWVWGIRTDTGCVHDWPHATHAPPEELDPLFGSLEPWVTVREALWLGGHDEAIRRLCGARIDGAKGWSGQRVIAPDSPAPTVTGGPNQELVIDTKRPRSAQPIDGPSPTITADGREHYRWSDAMRTKHPQARLDAPRPTIVGGSARSHTNGRSCVLDREFRDVIRRLTPDECARLQSVPGNFIWPASVPKTARYRIIGNGWACGMASAIAESVRRSDPAARTVVDLFCGGGLGAVGWAGRCWRQ